MMELNLIDVHKVASTRIDIIEEQSSHDIAITGMAIKMPSADTVEDFWNAMAQGRDCVTDFPDNRKKDTDAYLRFKNNGDAGYGYDIGSYLDEIDKFDFAFFNISPKEASLMDPNQRLFLEIAWKALMDAGYTKESVYGSKTGVYLGYQDTLYTYRQLISEIEPSSISISLPGNLSSVIASRIAYLLNLSGPSLIVDTACSSSLVAVHLACQGIKNRDCDMAIAGGVRISLLPLQRAYRFGVESASGKSKPFDDAADGIAAGEGVGVVILKPLSRALKERDNIHAVIKGSAVNQDGNTAGITAPNAVAQEAVIVNAWEDARVGAETISFMETHGTGTRLGDPIEITGIQGAFRRFTNRKQFCAIGSVKANLGHLDNSAGIAGLVKAVLQLEHKKIAPLIHFRKPNRQIDFIDSPVYINDRLADWASDGTPRRCGVSSFGLSGTNCHVVLEEAPQRNDDGPPESDSLHVFTLSAKSPDSLKENCNEYVKFLNAGSTPDMDAVCYTQNCRRSHMPYRIALIVKNADELRESIEKLELPQAENGGRVYFGHATIVNRGTSAKSDDGISADKLHELNERAKSLIESRIGKKDKDKETLGQLCELYVRGADIDWDRLSAGNARHAISLPTYSFEKKRCWLDIPQRSGDTVRPEERMSIKTGDVDRDVCIKLLGEKDGNYTEAEILVGSVIGRVLGYTEIDIYKNYFELGGDSLLAVNIVSALKSRLGKEVEIAHVLSSQTIKEFALFINDEYLDKGKKTSESSDGRDCILKPARAKEYYDVLVLVERFWFFNQLAAHPTAVNIFNSINLENIDTVALKTAFAKIVERHEILRSVFLFIDGKVRQKIIRDESTDGRFAFFDIRGDENKKSMLRDMESRLRDTIFDFEKEPLFKAALIRTGEIDFTLCFVMHHAVADGWSMEILQNELMTFYASASGNRTIDIPIQEIQFKDYAEWVNDVTRGRKGEEEILFWLEQLKNFPEKNLSTALSLGRPKAGGNPDYLSAEKSEPVLSAIRKLPVRERERYGEMLRSPMIDPSKGAAAEYTFFLEPEPLSRLQQCSNALSVSLYTVLIAALNIHIFKTTGLYDNSVAINVINREHPELRDVVGYLLNLVVLRNKIEQDKTVRGFISEVNDNIFNVYAHKIVDFNDLCDRLGIRNIEADVPVLLTMATRQIKDIELADFRRTHRISGSHLQMDLHLDMYQYKNCVQMDCKYDRSLFKKSVITSFCDAYIRLLDTVAAFMDRAIEDVEY